jgi:hypothetical protein
LSAGSDPRHYIEQAIARAGSRDFGAPGWEQGLERTLDAFARLPLTPQAREAVHNQLIGALATRLRIEQWYRDHPEVEAQQIAGPLMVCGLPRTGTTATIGMLALDHERFRFLRAWEAMSPVPPPKVSDGANDSRAVATRAASQGRPNPEQHIHDTDGPEEDQAMLAPLTMQAYHGALPMPQDYLDWWKQADFSQYYAYQRRVLKLLQSECGPNRWLLKSPVHLFRLDQFAAEYPDAKFVWTHRDPAKVIPSVSSLQYTLWAARCEPGFRSKEDTGQHFLAFWSEGMRRGLEARAQIGEDRFIDVWNDDLAADPVGAFAALYDRLGHEFTPELKARIEDYNRRNARGAHGEHRYTAEEFGLTREAIREAFADYVGRFRL